MARDAVARVPRVALAGNPNVGKSTLFNQLTGVGVMTAHYPGTTYEVAVGKTRVGTRSATVVDLPGTYSLSGDAEHERLARRELLERRPDAVLAVVDETNLGRNLYLVLQLLDLGLPVVVALNLHDEAGKLGLRTDVAALTEALGVPVAPTVALHGHGVAEALELALALGEREAGDRWPRYGEAFEALIEPLVGAAEAVADQPWSLSGRAVALQLLEGAPDLERELVLTAQGGAAVRLAGTVRARLASVAGGMVGIVARERYALAGVIAEAVQSSAAPVSRFRDSWTVATSRVAGTLILAGVLAAVFGTLFFVGESLSRWFSWLWGVAIGAPSTQLVERWLGSGVAAHAVRWAIAGVEASLAIGIPYILTFYVLLSVLEDTGYLNAVAFLADRVMHRFGLHGLAVVPIVGAAGCNVPAVLAASNLPSRRERLIACTLVTFVPCSARTAVILGSVGAYVGVLPALAVLGVVMAVIVVAGVALDRALPGAPSGMVMEVFPFRRPTLGGVLGKAWAQFREFLTIAVPVVVAGSVVLGVLYETGWLWRLTAVLDPVVVGWLGLPSVAGLTLLLGLLRKELALQLLVTLAVVAYGTGVTSVTAFMTPTNVFVYALVNTLAIPCVSTLAVLGRRLGWRAATVIAGATVVVALLLGGAFARMLPYAGWT